MVELWDTSALIVASRREEARLELAAALDNDEVTLTEPIVLEYLNGSRNLPEYERDRRQLGAFRQLTTMPADWERALEVHHRLAALGAGHQRSVQLVDLIIAATAERARLPIVHVDEDYERISAITGQATRRLRWTA